MEKGALSVEQKTETVEKWISALSEEGKLGQIDRMLLKDVLGAFGANFEVGEETKTSLEKYTNKAKAVGMEQVWGSKYDKYKKFTLEFIRSYEESKGVSLPALKRSGIKNSGMIQFFGEITAYAAGSLDFESLKLFLEARVLNGKAWADGRKEDRVRVKVPTAREPILLSSIPSEFPEAAWKEIKSWR
jgi:hypothetical protein